MVTVCFSKTVILKLFFDRALMFCELNGGGPPLKSSNSSVISKSQKKIKLMDTDFSGVHTSFCCPLNKIYFFSAKCDLIMIAFVLYDMFSVTSIVPSSTDNTNHQFARYITESSMMSRCFVN
jgi:hypothetical protein